MRPNGHGGSDRSRAGVLVFNSPAPLPETTAVLRSNNGLSCLLGRLQTDAGARSAR